MSASSSHISVFPTADFNLIGKPVARPDAYGKVTGATRYPADLVREGMVHLKAVFAHRAHNQRNDVVCTCTRTGLMYRKPS